MWFSLYLSSLDVVGLFECSDQFTVIIFSNIASFQSFLSLLLGFIKSMCYTFSTSWLCFPFITFLFWIFSSSVQLLSHVWLFATPWTVARQASLSVTNSWSLLKLMSIELVMPSNHLSHPLSSPSPAFNLSKHHGLFQPVSSSYWVAKVLALQLQHQSFQWMFRTNFL